MKFRYLLAYFLMDRQIYIYNFITDQWSWNELSWPLYDHALRFASFSPNWTALKNPHNNLVVELVSLMCTAPYDLGLVFQLNWIHERSSVLRDTTSSANNWYQINWI